MNSPPGAFLPRAFPNLLPTFLPHARRPGLRPCRAAPTRDGSLTARYRSRPPLLQNITLFPKALPFTGLSTQEGKAPPTWKFNHTFVAATVGTTLDLDGPATP